MKSFSSSCSRSRRNISNLRVKSENAAKLEHCAVQSSKPEPLPVKPKVPIVRERLVETTELKPHGVMNRFNRGVASLTRSGGQSFDGKLLQYFKS